jgi:hypothetical protein
MSADGSITLVWGDGENKFRFGIGQFRELQDCVNQRRLAIGAPLVGPMSLLNLLKASDAWPDDVRDVLRIGMVGGGAPIVTVARKLAAHFDNSPPLEHMLPAFTVLLAGLAGAPGDQLPAKKKITRKTKTSTPQSSSPDSTGPALQ